MVEYVNGDILEADVVCIVNPVNCKGVMGAGLAKQIADRFPGVLEPYQRVCRSGQLRPGMLQLVRIDRATGARPQPGSDSAPFFILNLPTKDDWRDASRIEWIEEALGKVPGMLRDRGITSIAFPKLGSGLGGLDWQTDVAPRLDAAMRSVSGVRVLVYGEAPERALAGAPTSRESDPIEDLFGPVQTTRSPAPRIAQGGAARISQQGRVLNFSDVKTIPPGAIYIGRNPKLWAMSGQTGEPWLGNPFVMGKDGTREDVIRKYEAYLDEKLKDAGFRRRFVETLAGRDQVCHCAPQGCHGHVNMRKLAELTRSNAEPTRASAGTLPAIETFTTPETRFLSNMYPARVRWGDALTPEREWPNTEVPYVLAKTLDPVARAEGVRLCDANADKGPEVQGKILKTWGRKAPLRADWESFKIPLMQALVRDKFARNPDLARMLAATAGRELREGNYWGDTFWGVSLKDIPARNIKAGEGRNELGKILMATRDALERGTLAPVASSAPVVHEPAAPGPAPGAETRRDYKVYAGIGSRETPPGVIEKMRRIGEALAKEGWMLRSGRADGADIAFEEGATRVPGSRMQIFLPWADFKPKRPLDFALRHTPHVGPSAGAAALSAKFHPKWDDLTQGARKLQARNAHQMLGPDLDDRTDLVICWTVGGAVKGGTGQALRMAESYGVPVINLGADRWKDASVEEIVTAARAAASTRLARPAQEAPDFDGLRERLSQRHAKTLETLHEAEKAAPSPAESAELSAAKALIGKSKASRFRPAAAKSGGGEFDL